MRLSGHLSPDHSKSLALATDSVLDWFVNEMCTDGLKALVSTGSSKVIGKPSISRCLLYMMQVSCQRGRLKPELGADTTLKYIVWQWTSNVSKPICLSARPRIPWMKTTPKLHPCVEKM